MIHNKKAFLILFFSLFVFSCFAQEKYATDIPECLKYAIKNSKKFKYTTEFPSFEGNITVINDSLIQYDDKFIKLYDIHNDYKPIFYSGIFYPMILFDRYDGILLECVKIYTFREIKEKKQDYKTKRFIIEAKIYSSCNIKMLDIQEILRTMGLPLEYCLELKNENATKSTSLADFIAGARVIRCWCYRSRI